jgi:HEAT repeat protein
MKAQSPSALLAKLQTLASPADTRRRSEMILAALESESPRIREAAIGWAARWLEPVNLTDLVAHQENATLRNAGLAALARQGQFALAHLQSMLEEPNPEIVMFAAQVLAQIGSPESVPALLGLIRHKDPNVAQVAVDGLGRIGATVAVPALIELLGADLWLQLASVQALGDIGDSRAEAALLALVPASEVPAPALQALTRLGGPATLEAILGWVDRVELREPLLRAAGAVLERHPGTRPALSAFGRRVEGDHGETTFWRYLAGVLRGEIDASTSVLGAGDDRGRPRDGGELVRAAGALVVAAGIRSLYPDVMVWAGEPAGAQWVRTVSRHYGEELGPSIGALVGHPDSRVRRGALLAVSFGPEHLPLLRAVLHDREAEVRAAACRALAEVPDAESVDALLQSLRAGGTEERSSATAALGRLPGEALAGLDGFLTPGSAPDLQVAALEVVERAGVRAFDPRVTELLKSPTTAVRRAALRVIGARQDPQQDVTLFRALADRDQAVQVEALNLLMQRGGERVVRTLVALLSVGDSFRYHVIRALGRLGAAEAVPVLESLLDSSPLHERIEIISALVRIGSPGIVGLLATRLQEPDPDIRRAAAQGLGEVAGEEHLPLLQHIARDGDWYLRHEAARALGRLDPAMARPILMDLIRDLEPVVAQTARRSLEGEPGRPAGP